MPTVALGSGTAFLPQNFTIRGHPISRKALELGKELFDSGPPGASRPCGSCHDGSTRLSARSLDPKIDRLGELINVCVTHADRGHVAALPQEGKELLALEAWLCYRYRLRLKESSGTP